MYARKFTYLDYQTELTSSLLLVKFNFLLDELQFQEVLSFPLPANIKLNVEDFASSLSLLHLMLGISYYKAGIPNLIDFQNYHLNRDQSNFFEETFFFGLQEFAFRNQLDLRDQIKFSTSEQAQLPTPDDFQLSGILLPMGGGKDSMLCLDILHHENPLLLTLGRNPQVQEIAEIKKLELVEVIREIDPKLIELNQKGAYNGHVPFSAILGLVCVVVGLIYKKKYLVLGNERSANEANLEHLGTAVNHQYSKSFYFEKSLHTLIKSQVHSGLEYFSLLRQFSEVSIARELAKQPEFLNVFASCNHFKKISSDRSQKWCGYCAKCCFVFLCLAPFVEEGSLIKIFGGNLLDNPELLLEFQRLVGMTENKPWECVGEYAECRELFRLLAKVDKYQTSFVVTQIAKNISSDSELNLFDFHGENLIPKKFKVILDEYLRVN